jgi:hypothetical protein
MATIFISYRRDDAGGYAGRLCDRLTARFGDDHVFMDIEDIQPGQNFVHSIESTIGRCDVVAAVIGPRWLEMLAQRAQAENDFVRHEIATALARPITVIPVLVGGARMPEAAQLPPELSELSRLQAVEIRDDRFDDDMARLADALTATRARARSGAGRQRPSPARVLRWAVPLVAIVAVATAFVATRRGDLAAPGGAEPPASREAPTRPPAPAIDGLWTADMQDSQRRPFRIRLRLVQTGSNVAGVVDYPTGTAAIDDAALIGQQLTFSTTHTPQFESAPATIRFQSVIEGDLIRLTAISDAGVATGIARRTASP